MSEAPPPTPLDVPAEQGRRIVALDALRGLAVAGIAPMNVIAFALPAAAFYSPSAYGLEGAIDSWLWAAIFVLDEDKFRAVFAMLFGLGTAMLLDRPQQNPLRAHFLRMLVMFGIGFVHTLLFANNDVLRLYALCGLFLPLAVKRSPRALLIAAGAIVALYTAALGWFFWDWIEYFWGNYFATTAAPPGMEPFDRIFAATPEQVANSLALGHEGMGARIVRQFGNVTGPLIVGLAGFPPTYASMLVGIALWRGGMLAGHWDRARALRLGVVLLAVTVPLEIAMAAVSLASGLPVLVTVTNALVWSVPVDLAMGVGIAALAMAWFDGGGALTSRLAAAGRLALSNYLGTSLVFSLIFAGWGLGLFGGVSRSEAYALSLMPIALMLVLSPWWLTRFRQGPAEWLWRGLAAGRFARLKL